MSPTAEQVLKQALILPESERASVAARLIDSLDAPADADADAAWSDEIQRRLRELDSGAVKAVPWPEARRQIHGSFDDPGQH